MYICKYIMYIGYFFIFCRSSWDYISNHPSITTKPPGTYTTAVTSITTASYGNHISITTELPSSHITSITTECPSDWWGLACEESGVVDPRAAKRQWLDSRKNIYWTYPLACLPDTLYNCFSQRWRLCWSGECDYRWWDAMGEPPMSAMYYSNPSPFTLNWLDHVDKHWIMQADFLVLLPDICILPVRFCVLSTFIPWIVEEMLKQLILTWTRPFSSPPFNSPSFQSIRPYKNIKKWHRHKSGPVAFKDQPLESQRQRLLKWVTGREATPSDTTRTAKDVKLPLPVELLEPVVNKTIKKTF